MTGRHKEGESSGYKIYSDVEVGLDDVTYRAEAENKFNKVVYHTTGYPSRAKAVKMLISALGGVVLGLVIYF